jgi:hypothetical protein
MGQVLVQRFQRALVTGFSIDNREGISSYAKTEQTNHQSDDEHTGYADEGDASWRVKKRP